MDTKVINSLRNFALDMINEAGGGHPGIVLDAAPILYTVFANHLVFNSENPTWINRDRFVLSAGHASSLLYSSLFFSGYPIKIESIKNFRKINGLPAHPSYNPLIGVEVTTGALGSGFATSVGMAISEEYLRNLLGKDLINNYTYTLVSDGDLMEGISYEAASLAGSLKLSHLICLYDCNKISIDGKTDGVFDDDIQKRFESMGWNVSIVNSGEDYIAIDKAIIEAKSKDTPSLIIVKTIIGIGTFNAGTNKVHSGALKAEDLEQVKDKMSITKVPFHVSKDAYEYFRNKQKARNDIKYSNWLSNYNRLSDENKKKIIRMLEGNPLNLDMTKLDINYSDDMAEDMRVTNAKLMKIISDLNPLFVGGSADLAVSTKAYIEDGKDFMISSNIGKNIRFGVRENAMGAIINGMALSGLKPWCSTFLAFSDYLKPSLRLSAMMNIPSTYIFTHDSAFTVLDGETHVPVEELGDIRSIPNMTVFRPADVNELIAAWHFIVNNKNPVSLIIPKGDQKKLKGASINEALKGAYIIKKEEGHLSGIILATGSEVDKVLRVSESLSQKGIYTRVISMPSVELFNKESEEYKRELFVSGCKVIAIEASNDKVFNEFVYNKKYIVNINEFGKSGTVEENLNYFGFDSLSLLEKVESLLK